MLLKNVGTVLGEQCGVKFEVDSLLTQSRSLKGHSKLVPLLDPIETFEVPSIFWNSENALGEHCRVKFWEAIQID